MLAWSSPPVENPSLSTMGPNPLRVLNPNRQGGGWKWFSEIASNFPFANGRAGLKNRSDAVVNNSHSPSGMAFNLRPSHKAHPAVDSSKQPMAFQRHQIAEKTKTSTPSSARQDDEFAELGPIVLEGAKANDSLLHPIHKSMEANERAIAAKQIIANYPHTPLDRPNDTDHITVRINNISMRTSEPVIHSTCRTCGYVAGLLRIKKDAVDVVFKVKHKSAALGIAKRLDDISVDGCCWSAQLLTEPDQKPKNDAAAASSSEVGLKICDTLGSFRKQFHKQMIYLEDLEELHYAVLHLKERPVDVQSAA